MSDYEREQQRRLDESNGRYTGGTRDYSGYFKAIIIILLIPYIIKIVTFIYRYILLKETADEVARILNSII